MDKISSTNQKSNSLSIFLGGLTFFAFAAKPYILDLIEPAKSIGQQVGESAKDILASVIGDKDTKPRANSKRETWSSILTIASFVLFLATLIVSGMNNNFKTKKILIAIGPILALIGLAFFVYYTTLSIVATLVVAVLAVALLTGNLFDFF